MIIKLTGGKVYDPANMVDGEVRDIYIEDGRIVAPAPEAPHRPGIRPSMATSSWRAPSIRTRTSAAAR